MNPCDRTTISKQWKGIPFSRLKNREEVKNLEEAIKCELCYQILVDPQDCQGCERSYCKECIKPLIDNDKPCPFDCHPIEIKQSSIGIINILKSLKFQCVNEDCKQELSIENILAHDKDCTHSWVKCTNVKCFKKVRRQFLEYHVKSECEFTIMNCEFCDEILERKDMRRHQEKCRVIYNMIVLRNQAISPTEARGVSLGGKTNNPRKAPEDLDDFLNCDLGNLSMGQFMKIIVYQLSKQNELQTRRIDKISEDFNSIKEVLLNGYDGLQKKKSADLNLAPNRESGVSIFNLGSNEEQVEQTPKFNIQTIGAKKNTRNQKTTFGSINEFDSKTKNKTASQSNQDRMTSTISLGDSQKGLKRLLNEVELVGNRLASLEMVLNNDNLKRIIDETMEVQQNAHNQKLNTSNLHRINISGNLNQSDYCVTDPISYDESLRPRFDDGRYNTNLQYTQRALYSKSVRKVLGRSVKSTSPNFRGGFKRENTENNLTEVENSLCRHYEKTLRNTMANRYKTSASLSEFISLSMKFQDYVIESMNSLKVSTEEHRANIVKEIKNCTTDLVNFYKDHVLIEMKSNSQVVMIDQSLFIVEKIEEMLKKNSN